jgi:hypothetical protein
MADLIVLAGPLGKYLLAGLQEGETQRFVFQYLDLISEMWDYVIGLEDAERMVGRMKVILAQLERLLPSHELTINRHMMLHLAEAIVKFGPPWSWSMFPDERTWRHLSTLLRNSRFKEASVMANQKVWHMAVAAVQQMKAHVPDARLPLTLDTSGEDGSLRLPQYVAYSQWVKVNLSRSCGAECSPSRVPGAYLWDVALHRFFVGKPHLVKSCDHCLPKKACTQGCLSYADLWQMYLDDESIGVLDNHDPKGWEDLLLGWRVWATVKADLTPLQRVLCDGPENVVSLYRKGEVNGVQFATVKHCARDKAKNCVMMVKHDDAETSFGQAQDFLGTYPPGAQRGVDDSDWECWLVRFNWYINRGHDPGTNLPLLEKGPRKEHAHGDLWDMQYVVPTNIGVLPHWTNPDLVVVVHERSNFLDKDF